MSDTWLTFDDLEKSMRGQSCLEGYDVLVSYSETQLNLLLQDATAKDNNTQINVPEFTTTVAAQCEFSQREASLELIDSNRAESHTDYIQDQSGTRKAELQFRWAYNEYRMHPLIFIKRQCLHAERRSKLGYSYSHSRRPASPSLVSVVDDDWICP